MKETTKEIKQTTTVSYTVYVAEDGEEFRDKEQCKVYEESALFAVSKLLLDSCMKRIKDNFADKTIDQFLDIGMQRGTYFCFKLKTDKDKENLVRYTHLMQAHKHYYFNGTSDWWKEHSDYARPCITLDEVEMNKEYILHVCDDGEFFAIYNKEKYIELFKKAWFEACRETVN